MTSLDALGWDPFFEQQIEDPERGQLEPARVVWQGREHWRLSTGTRDWDGRLAGRLRHRTGSAADLPAVGDWVMAAPDAEQGSATIRRCLTRRSAFSRAAAGRTSEEQVVAANVDTALLVSSCSLDFNPRRLERYLTLTWESGARPVVVLNKADSCSDRDLVAAAASGVAQGVPIIVASALQGDGMNVLRDIIRTGGTTALLGSSGVGKSTIVNALLGSDRQGVLPVRAHDERGRHSTTARWLFCVPGGGIVIDTPGMRELQLWDAEAGLELAFADLRAAATSCRFRDCTHDGEPGCGVAMAVESGGLSLERLESYRRLMREDEFQRSRSDESLQQERKRRGKIGAKQIRLQAKLRRR